MTTRSPFRLPVGPVFPRPGMRSATVLRPVVGLALVFAVAACGGGGGSSSSVNSASTNRPSSGSGSGSGQGQNGPRPGASGTIAAVNGTSAEVQNQTDGQVTVNWTSKTTFSKTTTVAASAVAVGDCVTAVGGTSTGSTAPTAFTATTVTVTKPVNGTCVGAGARFGGGAGGPGAGGFRGFNGTPAPGASPRPARTRPAGAGRLDAAFGQVTSVSGATFVVKGVERGAARTGATASPAPTTNTSVTIGSSTTVEQTSPATSSAVVVGQCMTAFGKADDTGAVTATTISVRPPSKSGGCATGFGGFRGRFGGGQNPGGTTNG